MKIKLITLILITGLFCSLLNLLAQETTKEEKKEPEKPQSGILEVKVDSVEGEVEVQKAKDADWIIYVGQTLPRELSHESEVPIIHIPIKDGIDDIQKWKVANKIISECEIQGKTLVACRGGISRSPMVCLIFLLANKFYTNFDE